MISCGARLAVFDIAELREVTSYDELELDTLGDRKTALFLIMSDTDDSFNFLISMCYTQLFNLLCEKADDVYGGRLPVHVRCLIDECANIGQIPKLEKLVATIRSREISACLVLQAQSQLKAIYKDNADTIIGNMDTSIFLGGKEPTIPTRLFKQAVNLSKQARAIEATLDGITPFNAGKKKEEALSLLKKWFPQMENFSGQLKKYKVTINDLLAENEQLEARAKASEKGKMKDTMERAKLESELKDIQRLVDRIPPEVLAELKRQQQHTKER